MKKILLKWKTACYGAYALSFAAILLACLLIIGVLTSVIPTRYTTVQTGGDRYTSISQQTKNFLDTITEPVTVYRLSDYEAEGDSLGITDEKMDVFLSRYTDYCDNITLVDVDMGEEPDFTAAYTTEDLPHGSYILESSRRYWVISADSLCVYSNTVLDEMFGQTTVMSKSQLIQYMNYIASYYEGGQEYLEQSTTTGYFQGEALFTSALDYITADVIPHGYLLTGHGDATLPDQLMQELTLMGIAPLDLTDADEIPADADCLILYAPTKDLSEREYNLLRDFTDKGGSLLLATSYTAVDTCPRVMTLGQGFGLTALPGQVLDSDSSHHMQVGNAYLIPDYNESHILTYTVAVSGGVTAFMPFSHAIAIAQTLPDGVTASPLLYTSQYGRRVSASAETIGSAGYQYVAVCADKTVKLENGTEKTGHLIWFGSTEAFTAAMASAGNYSGYTYFAYAVQYLSSGYSSPYSSIAYVNMSGNSLTELTVGDVILWVAVLLLILPLLCIIAGVVIRIGRKKRAVQPAPVQAVESQSAPAPVLPSDTATDDDEEPESEDDADSPDEDSASENTPETD